MGRGRVSLLDHDAGGGVTAVFTAGIAMALGQHDHAAETRVSWGVRVRHVATGTTYDRCVACYERYYRDASHVVLGAVEGAGDCAYCSGRRLAESRQARLESHDHA
jgi:hypothetical protein